MLPGRKDYLLVLLQGLLILAYAFDLPFLKLRFPMGIRIAALIIGLLGALVVLLAVIQLNKHLSPFPTPRAGSKLIQNGLYKYVRHPIYAGLLMAFSGYAIYSLSGFRFLLSLALYVLFVIKLRYEESLLLERFSEYAEYRKKTAALFPRLW